MNILVQYLMFDIVNLLLQLQKLDISFNQFSRKGDGEIIGKLVVVCGIQSLNISYAHLTSEMLEAFLQRMKGAKVFSAFYYSLIVVHFS